MRRTVVLLACAGAVLGLAAEAYAYRWDAPRHWLPDLVTGWALIACGLIAWSGRSAPRTGLLMSATGFAWFAGNFSEAALYLHRGPLVHLVLAYPAGALAGRLARTAVAAGYVVAVVPLVWQSEPATIVGAALLVAVAARSYARAIGRARRERLAALEATTVVAATLAAIAAARLAVPTPTTDDVTLLVYEAMLCLLAVALLAGLARAPWERAALTDLVVEVGETRSAGLRDVLARTVGDPRLEVGYWLEDRGVYVDARGLPLDLTARAEAALTTIERDGRRVAALVHDPAVLDDPVLVDAVTAAARLSAQNARLRAEVQAQVSELKASRRRLVQAGDEQRRRLERLLRDGAQRRLEELRGAVAVAARRADAETRATLDRADDQLAALLADLRELAAGLHPRALAERGLPGALAELAARSPAAVELSVADEQLPDEVQEAVYFVCAEALANVAKHASASRVAVTVDVQSEIVSIVVADDGVGGADDRRGSGLRGLGDRVEAVGGSLAVESPPGGGTRLTAEIPLSPFA
jgi:signal transduction histidine kinase